MVTLTKVSDSLFVREYQGVAESLADHRNTRTVNFMGDKTDARQGGSQLINAHPVLSDMGGARGYLSEMT